MRALVEALRAGPRRERSLAAIAAVTAVVAIAALGLAWKRAPPRCADPAASWAEAWSPSRDAAIHAAFARSGRPSAAFAEAAVARSLDAYGAAWIAARASACEAADKDPPSEPSNRRLVCLEERKLEVAALARALAEADGDAVDAAPAALSTLPRAEECAAGAALRRAVLPSGDAAHRAAMERLRERLAEARALEAAGRAPAGLAIAVPAVAEAKALGESGLVGRLLYVQGALEYGAGQNEAAASTLHAAAETALGAGDDATAADAWILLTRVAGHRLGRAAEGRQWTSYAEAAIRRLGGDDAREAARLYSIGLVAWSAERRLDEARDAFEKARALAEKSLGPLHPWVGAADTGLGNVLLAEARPDQALIAHQRAATLQEQILGPDAPATRFARGDVAVDLVALGRLDEAIALLVRTLADLERGCPGCDDAFLRHRLAAALRAKGDAERALAEDRRAQQTMTRLGAPDRERAWAMAGEGMDLLALGRPGEAVSPLESALALREKSAAPAEIAEVQLALAQALWQSGGDRARALALAAAARDGYREDASRHGGYYQRALESAEAWLADHPAEPPPAQPPSRGAAARGGAAVSMAFPAASASGRYGMPVAVPAAAASGLTPGRISPGIPPASASGGVPGHLHSPAAAAGSPPPSDAQRPHD
jgi:serine/threonine-protein kinase